MPIETPGGQEKSMHYTDKHNPLAMTALLLTLALALIGTCELYNNSMPDFVDDHTNVVWGTGWKNALPGVFLSRLSDELLWLDSGTMNAGKNLMLVVTVANPRHIGYKADILLVEDPPNENSPDIEGVDLGLDQLLITIPADFWAESRGFKVTVVLSSLDGSRVFEPYTAIPSIQINETPPPVSGGIESRILTVKTPTNGTLWVDLKDRVGEREFRVPVGESVMLLAEPKVGGYMLDVFTIRYKELTGFGTESSLDTAEQRLPPTTGENVVSFSMPASDITVSALYVD
jgi:hypothetical protein